MYCRTISFVLVTSSLAFFLFSLCYLLVDHFVFWNGSPFIYPGKYLKALNNIFKNIPKNLHLIKNSHFVFLSYCSFKTLFPLFDLWLVPFNSNVLTTTFLYFIKKAHLVKNNINSQVLGLWLNKKHISYYFIYTLNLLFCTTHFYIVI